MKKNFSDIGQEDIRKALLCLVDNGIEPSEAGTVLQALCYILLDEEIEDILDSIEHSSPAAVDTPHA